MYLPYPEPLREDAGFVQASRDSIFLETLSFEMKVQYNRVDWFPPHCASNLHSVQLVSDREARKPLLWSRSPQLHGPSMWTLTAAPRNALCGGLEVSKAKLGGFLSDIPSTNYGSDLTGRCKLEW
ncbi:hypothetical protein CIHG_06850 [Coccidioides immitis H538.4]|nr:hypothetical protein CIHG_06850 [Coccidioides immitis H538.4]